MPKPYGSSGWEVVNAAASQLESSGDVRFEIPSVDATVPSVADLVYTPWEGPYCGVQHFVGYVPSGSTILPAVMVANTLHEISHLPADSDYRFVVVTNSEVLPELAEFDVPSNVRFVGGVSTGAELAAEIAGIVGGADQG